MTIMAFENAVKIILKHEGGYVNDPDDPGGETAFGICKRSYPDLDIRNLTVEQAKEIYYRDYWMKAYCHEIRNHQLAIHVFDMAVNAGVTAAIRLLQGAVSTSQDGRFGPVTKGAVNGYPRQLELVWKYKYLRLKYYAEIVASKRRMAKFLKAWVNRVETTKFEV